jgi:short-subunit dehydrogenase
MPDKINAYLARREEELTRAHEQIHEQHEWAMQHGQLDLARAYSAGEVQLLTEIRVTQMALRAGREG